MDRRDLRLLLGLAALSCVALLALAGGALPAGAMYAVPVALLVVPLLAGRFVGEETLHRLAARRSRIPRRRIAGTTLRPRRPELAAVRGGLLLASSLAKRPPPAAALAR